MSRFLIDASAKVIKSPTTQLNKCLFQRGFMRVGDRTSKTTRSLSSHLCEKHAVRSFPVAPALQERPVRVFSRVEDVFSALKGKNYGWLSVRRDRSEN